MNAHSVLTLLGTLLLLGAAAAAVYVWLAYTRWSELRFRERRERLRSYEVLGALGRSGEPVSDRARRSFLRAVGAFVALLVAAVVLLELRGPA